LAHEEVPSHSVVDQGSHTNQLLILRLQIRCPISDLPLVSTLRDDQDCSTRMRSAVVWLLVRRSDSVQRLSGNFERSANDC
jgi:hypothetical protein